MWMGAHTDTQTTVLGSRAGSKPDVVSQQDNLLGPDSEESQVRCHKRSLQQTNPTSNILLTPAAVLTMHRRHRPAGGQSTVHVTAAVVLNGTIAGCLGVCVCVWGGG